LPSRRGCAAIFKRYDATDKIARVSDVILTDLSALSDGVPHPYAIFTDGAMFDVTDSAHASVLRFYTLVYLYNRCNDRTSLATLSADSRTKSIEDLLHGASELTALLNFDTESLHIRTVSASLAKDGSGDAEVVLRMRDGDTRCVRIICTEDERLFEACDRCTQGDRTVLMDDDRRRLLWDACLRLRQDGCRILLYATRSEKGSTVFEGLVALREGLDVEAMEKIDDLARHHVRVSWMLSDVSAHELTVLRQCGLLADGEVPFSLKGMPGDGVYEVYREQTHHVYVGADDEMIKTLLADCRSKHAIMATLGLQSCSAHQESDLHITYEDTPFRSDGTIGTGKPVQLTSEEDRLRSVRRAKDADIAASALLLRRGNTTVDTLDGLIGAIRTARVIEKNMALMLQYMLVSQFLRMTLVLLSLLFGVTLLSASMVLISGMWVDLGFILLLAFRRGGYDELLLPAKGRMLFDHPIRVRPDRVCAAILTGIVVLVLSAVLHAAGPLASDGAQALFVFISLLLTQAMAILLFYFGGSERDARPIRTQLPILGMLLLILLPVMLLLCLPGFAGLLQCMPISLSVLVLSSLSMPIYAFFCFVCARLRLKMQRLIRKYFPMERG
jgi:hypothetical protein